MKLCSAPATEVESNPKHTETLKTAFAFLIIDFKEAADVMKDTERQAYFGTGQRCPQGPDLALSNPTRGIFKMLHS